MKITYLLAGALLASPLAWAEPAESAAGKAAPADAWKLSVGGGLAYIPRYEGADSHRYQLMPFVNAEKGHFFAGIMRGIGYNFSDDRSMQYGVRMTLSHGRKQSLDPHLNGMGDINYAGEIGAFASVRFAPWYVSSTLGSSAHGTRFDLGSGVEARLSAADSVRLGVNIDWADARYNQTFFGVSDVQALASGNVLTAYDGTAGFKDYGLSASWIRSYSREWSSNAGVSSKKLLGSAAHSPLTVRDTSVSVNVGVSYRF